MNRGLLRSELQAYLVKANNQLIKHQVDIKNDTTELKTFEWDILNADQLINLEINNKRKHYLISR